MIDPTGLNDLTSEARHSDGVVTRVLEICNKRGLHARASAKFVQTVEKFEAEVKVKRVDTGEGVAILTDMFGGTPSNLAISVMGRPKVEVLAGINLPMLVKLAKVRDECPLTEAVAAAQDSGRKYITIASRVLNGK